MLHVQAPELLLDVVMQRTSTGHRGNVILRGRQPNRRNPRSGGIRVADVEFVCRPSQLVSTTRNRPVVGVIVLSVDRAAGLAHGQAPDAGVGVGVGQCSFRVRSVAHRRIEAAHRRGSVGHHVADARDAGKGRAVVPADIRVGVVRAGLTMRAVHPENRLTTEGQATHAAFQADIRVARGQRAAARVQCAGLAVRRAGVHVGAGFDHEQGLEAAAEIFRAAEADTRTAVKDAGAALEIRSGTGRCARRRPGVQAQIGATVDLHVRLRERDRGSSQRAGYGNCHQFLVHQLILL